MTTPGHIPCQPARRATRRHMYVLAALRLTLPNFTFKDSLTNHKSCTSCLISINSLKRNTQTLQKRIRTPTMGFRRILVGQGRNHLH